MARKYFIETFGCQMNLHDAERVSGLLEEDGYERTDDERAADLVVINTCSVRERAAEKVYSRLGEVREATIERAAAPIVAVMGCVAQQEGERMLRRDPSIDVVVGTQRLKDLPRLVSEAARARRRVVDISPRDDVSFPLGVARHTDAVRARVTIVEGCNEFCAFCVVPYTRGHERMRPAADILAEVRDAARTGHREVQLLGQIVNHYQAPDDPSCDFAVLLERVSDVPGIDRIRFASPHPRHVSSRLIGAIRDLPKVCKHLHLPVQSGSNAMLRAMRRRHTREDYFALVDRLRDAIPDIALSTDMIVGFPGETDADFEQTLDLVRHVRYHSMFSFKYSPRPNTLALKRMPDDVPERVKTERIVALQRLQAGIQHDWHVQAVGRIAEVLVDATSRRRSDELAGRTSGNTVVNFPGPPEWLNTLRRVRITAAAPNSLRGEAVDLAATPLAG
ncbi:MAG: tRNA (N6-isopentenyl adenosine(37)-C2)-methylthiotransferase MiaB [Acidobacteriota bacterium]